MMTIRNDAAHTLLSLMLIALLALCALQANALPIEGTVSIKPFTVSPLGNVNEPNIALDIQYADKIYSQVGIDVSALASGTVAAQPPGGAGTTWNNTGNAITGGAGLFGNNVANAVNLYYLPSFGSFGQAWGDEDIGGGVSDDGFVVTQSTAVAGTPAGNAGPRRNDTVAHELGHVLTNNWRWRTAEEYTFANPSPPPATLSQGFHSGNYAAATSPYVNNTGNNNMMAAGAVRNVPTMLSQVAPEGTRDQIHFNIGRNDGNAPNANQVTFQISSMYNNNSQIANVVRDNITATVGATTSAAFGWGLPQTISGVLVNEAARIGTPFVNNLGTESIMFHYRSPGVFVQGGGLVLGFADIDSLEYIYTGVNSLSVMMVDDILTNPGVFTSLTEGTHYTSAVVFTGTELTTASVAFTNLPAGQKDILVMLSMKLQVPEPGSLVLISIVVAACGSCLRRERARPTIN